jgi:PAS domain S-box-containing protein
MGRTVIHINEGKGETAETSLDFQDTDLYMNALKLSTEHSYSGVYIIRGDETVLYLNRWASQILGLEPEEVLNKKTTDFFPNAKLVNVMRSGIPQINVSAVRNNREIIVTRLPIYKEGAIIGGIAIFQDYKKIQKTELEFRSKFMKQGFTARYKLKFTQAQTLRFSFPVKVVREKNYLRRAFTMLAAGRAHHLSP